MNISYLRKNGDEKIIVKNAKDNCATSWSVTESSAETPGY